MDKRGYECECGFDCGLIFEDSAYEEALHKYGLDGTMTILHPDCKFVGEFKTIVEKTDNYIIVLGV